MIIFHHTDMVINEYHHYVNRDGLVEIDYLKNWKPEHDILGLVAHLSSIFSDETPVYAKSEPRTNGNTTNSNLLSAAAAAAAKPHTLFNLYSSTSTSSKKDDSKVYGDKVNYNNPNQFSQHVVGNQPHVVGHSPYHHQHHSSLPPIYQERPPSNIQRSDSKIYGQLIGVIPNNNGGSGGMNMNTLNHNPIVNAEPKYSTSGSSIPSYGADSLKRSFLQDVTRKINEKLQIYLSKLAGIKFIIILNKYIYLYTISYITFIIFIFYSILFY